MLVSQKANQGERYELTHGPMPVFHNRQRLSAPTMDAPSVPKTTSQNERSRSIGACLLLRTEVNITGEVFEIRLVVTRSFGVDISANDPQ